MTASVAVLGAGPAGLMAAWRAASAGHRVVVHERAQHVGGMAASFDVGGVRVDHGSHRLHPSTEPELLAAVQGLLGGRLQWRPRNGRIRLEGRWVGFPLRASDLVRSLPASFALSAARDAVLAPLRRAHGDTFAEVVRVGLGPTMLHRFYGPYARKLWGLAPEDLAGEQARRRVGTATAGAVLRRLRRERPGFWYPEGGFGEIVDALAAAAVDAGAELRLGSEVTSLDGLDADHVWSTIPLTSLARLAGHDPGLLAFRALVLVYVVVGRAPWTSFDAHYLPGPETPVSRVSEPRNYRASAADPSDRTVLCAEIPCTVGDATWTASDDDLGALVARDLVAAGLPAAEPLAVTTRRLPAAYPIYGRWFEPALAALDAWAEDLPRVVTFGRGGLFAHDNTHHALAMGWAAADALRPDGSWDAVSWAAARARFRTHVVED